MDKIDTVIVGGGQAGLAMSEQLSARGIPHLILERHRIAERWRTERWDGLHANGPAWHDRLPLFPIPDVPPDGFASRDQMVSYFIEYAERIAAPVREGVAVTAVHRLPDNTGFRAETSHGVIEATRVIAATGPFQRGVIPPMVPAETGIVQIHSNTYRNPAQMPDGAVLVVGAGSSGAQIANELARAGRRVFLSVGSHQRPPRQYRGRDFGWWLKVLGIWQLPAPPAGRKHVTIAVSGAHGGETIDFRRMAARGITLLGRAERFDAGAMHFTGDLAANIAAGDASHRDLLDDADAYVAREGLDLPPDPGARDVAPDPDCLTSPLPQLDLAQAGIASIIWSTGFALDFGWLPCATYTARGVPIHQRGVTDIPGLYVLGLSWLSSRASSFIFGAEHDATYLAEHIAKIRGALLR